MFALRWARVAVSRPSTALEAVGGGDEFREILGRQLEVQGLRHAPRVRPRHLDSWTDGRQ